MPNEITVLHVEDNESLRSLLYNILGHLNPNWRVIEAQNGLEGFKLACSEHPDVIVLDYHMPVMNGYEMAIRLQQCHQTCNIPLILNSSEDEDHPDLVHLRAMCRAQLGKPFLRRDIERAFRHILLHSDTPGNHR